MPSAEISSKNNAPTISAPCPTCGKEMSLTGVTPTSESVVYDYLCSNDGDRLSWQPRHYRAEGSAGGK